MAKVSLRNYNREIEGLIEHGQLDEAIAHCRHILKIYPKHLETYRLLGKAYLEAKRYKEALDIFQRVLMAVPDDFVSHVGMSIINDDQNKLDESIWHMERAFEVQPSNGAIQGELQRLFGRRDGVEPPKIRLTRGALAHMYVQGELYPQAISEIRAVLNNDQQRIDMQVLLAKTYFLGGQKAEATDICSQLIKRYPYCLDANRILVEILPGPQRAESAQVYQQRVNELDPYAAFAQDSVFRSDEVADGTVSLERLEYSGQSVDMGANWASVKGLGLPAEVSTSGSSQPQPEWLKAAASSVPAVAPVPPPSSEPIPDFLRQAGWTESNGEAQEAPSPFAVTNEPESSEGAAVQADLPDWIKAMAPAGATASIPAPEPADMPEWLKNTSSGQPPVANEPSVPSDQTPDWLKGLGGQPPMANEPSVPSDQAPDWLKGIDNQPPPEPAPQEEPLSDTGWLRGLSNQEPPEPIPESEQPLSDTGWLRRLGEQQTSKPALQPQMEQTSEETPDWLKGLDNDLIVPFSKGGSDQPEQAQTPPQAPSKPAVSIQQNLEMPPPAVSGSVPAAGLGGLGTSAQEQDDAMAWLESLAAKHGAKPEELVTDPNARTDVAPQWVDKAKEIGEQAQVPQPATPTEDETGMWLRKLDTPGTDKDSSKTDLKASPAAQKAPDWFSDLSDRDAFKGMSDVAEEKEEAPILGSQDTPDWLNDLESKAVQPPPSAPVVKDVPDWLKADQAKPPQPEAARMQTTPLQISQPDSFAATDLPDWLAGLDKEEPSRPAPAASEIPDWLKSETQPETTERTQPADWQPVESISPEIETPTEYAVEPEISQQVSRKVEQEETRPIKKPSPPSVRPKQPVAISKSADVSLDGAQSEMGRGNIAASLEMYNRLIRKGKSLEEIIRDLRDALYRYPVEVPIWQSLGDAYMRANRLQEALDAYTKAEELLR